MPVLQEIANDEDFAIPYWDWTENQMQCNPSICSEDFLGVTDQSNGIVKGKYFEKWWTICTREETNQLTKICNPNDRITKLTRNTDEEKARKERDFTMTFPTSEEVSFALRFKSYDVPPYSKESSCSFRNILEGYANTKTGYRLPNAHTLHNQVHAGI